MTKPLLLFYTLYIMIKGHILSREFFARPTLAVAKDLLGCYLLSFKEPVLREQLLQGDCHIITPDMLIGGGEIVEVEGYLGFDDAACHSYRGKKTRTKVMYGEAGFAYIYFIYGLHHCLNAVTEKEGAPEGVLIRALAPIFEGTDKKTFSGPGKLTKALSITRDDYASDLTGQNPSRIIIFKPQAFKIPQITKTTRVGVDYSGEAANYPYRFYITGNKSISKK